MFLSEPVILDRRCTKCGKQEDIFALASNYDERLTFCEHCQAHSNSVRIVDRLPYAELVDGFEDKSMPVKFLYFFKDGMQFMFELED